MTVKVLQSPCKCCRYNHPKLFVKRHGKFWYFHEMKKDRGLWEYTYKDEALKTYENV